MPGIAGLCKDNTIIIIITWSFYREMIKQETKENNTQQISKGQAAQQQTQTKYI
jgi:hypothetical protein